MGLAGFTVLAGMSGGGRAWDRLPTTPRPAKATVSAAPAAPAAASAPEVTPDPEDDVLVAGERIAAEAAIYLRSQQAEDGSWSPEFGPAITGLCVTVLMDQPEPNGGPPVVDAEERRAIEYILTFVKPDGSIQRDTLASYNTAICVSALARVRDSEDPNAADLREQVAPVIDKAIDFLRAIQWADGMVDPQGTAVTESHPWFGGWGYGNKGRPDLSNVQFMLQAFEDAGVSYEDESVQRAMTFLNRCQGAPTNDMFDEEVVPHDGGMIYSTSIDRDHIGVPESKASQDMIDEGLAGRPVSGLRSYGSMTYAGFKGMLYANLRPDDERVRMVREWVSRNYTLERNPGMPPAVDQHGYYYYVMTFGKALAAAGEPVIITAAGDHQNWTADLVRVLDGRQREDGAFINDRADRWMESDPNLVTSYAMLGLRAALESRAAE